MRRKDMTRRDAVRLLGLVAGGLAAACTPLRIVTGAYPAEFDDGDLTDRALRAFVLTVVPGAPQDDPNLIRAFDDPFYPFAPYRAFFAADLASRSARFGATAFDQLGPDDRTTVIREGLASEDAIVRKLYNGAVLLAQVSVYAGIYDDGRGSPLIDFDGRYRYRVPVSHPDPERFLALPLTANGNYR